MARRGKEPAPWQRTVEEDRLRREETIGYAESGLPEITVPSSTSLISIPRQLLPPAVVAITESPLESLLSSLAAGQISSVNVLSAFMQRARIAHKLTNCLVEFLPERALSRAQYLDQYLAEHKKPIGPLHGLPCSVKEHLAIKDRDVTASLVGWVGRKCGFDASVVGLLERQGGIAFARTTQPQGLCMVETRSNLYGITTNPHNPDLTPGGSSGGEGALVALKGSAMGIGSDFGGSIRVPAGNCGLYGFKPSVNRIPLMGMMAPSTGSEGIYPVSGPLTPTLEGIKTFMKAVLGARPWDNDPSVHQIEWRDESPWLSEKLAVSKLRIGVIWDDGVVKPLPPVERALKEVVGRLSLVPEIEIVNFEQDYSQGHALFTKLASPDAGSRFQEVLDLSGEPWEPLNSYIAREAPEIAKLDLPGVWSLASERDVYRHTYFEKWNKSRVDVVLCPLAPGPAPLHGHSRYWGYASVWNLVDYPSMAFPVTKVDVNKDMRNDGYKCRNDHEIWAHGCYDLQKQAGAPIGLQLVAPRMADEKLVEVFGWIKEKIGLPFVDSLSA